MSWTEWTDGCAYESVLLSNSSSYSDLSGFRLRQLDIILNTDILSRFVVYH